MVTTSPILIDGSNSVFGGKVIDVSFVIEYSGPSKISVSVASADGNYSISDADIKVDPAAPVKISFGTDAEKKEFKGYLIGYSTKLEGGIKTLSLDYYDSSIVDLDKKIVLLRGHHISSENLNDPNINLKSVILVGNYYETPDGSSGNPATKKVSFEYGDVVLYGIKDLILEMRKKGIKISQKVDSTISDSLNDEIEKIEKDYVGSVRDVLNSWGEDLGLMFYWDCFAQEVNVIDLSKHIDAEDVESEITKMGECTCSSWDQKTTIENNFSEAAVLIARDSYSQDSGGGAIERVGTSDFRYFDALDRALVISHNETVLSSSMVIENNWVTGLSDLLNAAELGEKFYSTYITKCLLHVSWTGFDWPLWVAEQDGTPTSDPYATSADAFPCLSGLHNLRYNNPVVNYLYGSVVKVKPKFEIASFTGEVKSAVLTEPFKGYAPAQSLGDEIGTDLKYVNLNNNILCFEVTSSIVVPEKKGVETAQEKITRESAERRLDSLLAAFTEPSRDTVFNDMNCVLNHANRWFFSTKLISSRKFSKRKYEKKVDWIYRKIDAEDSSVGQFITDSYIDSGGDEEKDRRSTITVSSEPIRFGGEASTWKKEILLEGDISAKLDSVLSSVGTGVVGDNPEEEDGESDQFKLDVYPKGVSVVEYLYPDVTPVTASITSASYDRLASLRSSEGMDNPSDYGIIWLDTQSSARRGINKVDAAAPEQKILGQGIVAVNAQKAKVYNMYTKAVYEHLPFLTGQPLVQIWPEADIEDTEGYEEMMDKIYKFKFSTSESSTASSGDDENENFVKAAYVKGLDSKKTVSSSVDVSEMSVNEMLGILGIKYVDATKQAVFTSYLIPLAKRLAKIKAYIDETPTFSKQITHIGIPSYVPSIEGGLESLSISVSDDGVQTQVSIGNRKAKREAIERRKRNVSKKMYGSVETKYSLIPNGRFSTRFLAGINI